jgi:hypothetical protein
VLTSGEHTCPAARRVRSDFHLAQNCRHFKRREAQKAAVGPDPARAAPVEQEVPAGAPDSVEAARWEPAARQPENQTENNVKSLGMSSQILEYLRGQRAQAAIINSSTCAA